MKWRYWLLPAILWILTLGSLNMLLFGLSLLMTFAAAYLLIEENKKQKVTWRIIANSRGWWIAVLMAWTALWFVPLTPSWDGPTFLFALGLTVMAVVLRIVAYPKEQKKVAKRSRK